MSFFFFVTDFFIPLAVCSRCIGCILLCCVRPFNWHHVYKLCTSARACINYQIKKKLIVIPSAIGKPSCEFKLWNSRQSELTTNFIPNKSRHRLLRTCPVANVNAQAVVETVPA